MELVKDAHGSLFSRKKLVLVVANKDGGSHVDPQLDDDYAAYRLCFAGGKLVSKDWFAEGAP